MVQFRFINPVHGAGGADSPCPHFFRLLDEIRFRLTPEAAARRMPRGLDVPEEDLKALEAWFSAISR